MLSFGLLEVHLSALLSLEVTIDIFENSQRLSLQKFSLRALIDHPLVELLPVEGDEGLALLDQDAACAVAMFEEFVDRFRRVECKWDSDLIIIMEVNMKHLKEKGV